MKPFVCSFPLCAFLSALGLSQTLESSACIEKNTVQIELESQYRVEKEGRLREGAWVDPGALIRLGVTDNMELQLGVPVVQEWGVGENETVSSLHRFGASQLGVTLNLWNEGRVIPEGAVMARAVIPMNGGLDFNALGTLVSLNLSRALAAGFNLGFNVGAVTSAEEGSAGFYIANLDYAPNGKIHCFLEYSNALQKACAPLNTLCAGFGLGLTDSIAVDFSIARGLDHAMFYTGGILTWVLGN